MKKQQLSLMSVLIVEDSTLNRVELVSILQLYFRKVLSASDGCEALEKIKNHNPNVIVSDIRMPCLDGLELAKTVKTEEYQPIIILTTAFSQKSYLLDALDIKVDGYLIKPINIENLLSKIESSLSSLPPKDLKYKKLSFREYEVFLDLSRGLKPSEIAFKYDIKAKTISTYRNRIFEKMGFKTNAELVLYAVKNNLI